VEGLVTLKAMINATMTKENFQKIQDPVFTAYYFEDEVNQDQIVSVTRMKEMMSQLGTPADQKKEVAISDAGTHIIGSDLFNMQVGTVWTPMADFCEQVLHLTPVKDSDWRFFLDFR
jgi:hypothetical protein